MDCACSIIEERINSMTYKQYKYLVLSDLFRITGAISIGILLRYVFFGEAFKFIFWMRTCVFLRDKIWFRYTIYPISLLIFNHYRIKFGINIPFEVEIGPGFYIGHFGGIVVYPLCKIGRNCNLSHGVTLGKTNRGGNKGFPIIGDNVYIGPGAKIIGNVKIGNYAAIGANCVVTKDVSEYGVVIGIPGKMISMDGSEGYINNTDYEGKT